MTTTTESSTSFSTHNKLSASSRAKVSEALNQHLANALDLQTQCKQAHWNIRGSNFIASHELFDEVHAAVAGYVDILAERVGQLGEIAGGPVGWVARTTELDEHPRDAVKAKEHMKALSKTMATFAQKTREGIEAASEAGDEVSADILTEVTRGADKWVWFIESHLGG